MNDADGANGENLEGEESPVPSDGKDESDAFATSDDADAEGEKTRGDGSKNDQGDVAPEPKRRNPSGIPPAQLRAIQDMAAQASAFPQAEIRRILQNMPTMNDRYAEIARQAARGFPALDVYQRLPRLTFDASFAKLNKDLSESYAQLAKGILAATKPDLDENVRRIVERLQQSLQVDPDLISRLRENIERRVPENVRGLSVTDLLKLALLAVPHKLGVFYALSPERVREVLAADTDQQKVDELLAGFAEPDWAYFEGVLGKVIETKPALTGLATLLMEAVAALRGGYPAASQALSTAVWDTAISQAAGKAGKAVTYAKTLVKDEKDLLDSDSLDDLFESGVHAPLAAAYQTPNNSPLYSRNGTIHAAAPQQFTKANAVRALTIAVGLVAWSAMHKK